ncbi:hypothetical protein [Nitriliruptor alkaliphilus]|uniref:hypothetical protein n=1 Tax=Nitriliruptor alkaliphilus TaxID=427918 RepID=UPI000698C5C7|nr:hypothetical protein [Nitriliruptor alkaliphilus]
MPTFHLYTRTEYAEPLERLATFDAPRAPSLEDLPVDRSEGWLEVVLVPDDAITWVLRDADLVTHVEAPEVVE